MAVNTFTPSDLGGPTTPPKNATIGAARVTATYGVPSGYNYLTVAFPTLTASAKVWVKQLVGGNTITGMRDTRGSSYPAGTFGSNSVRTFLVAPGCDVAIAASNITATYTISAFAHKG